jgi:hypothetical protein
LIESVMLSTVGGVLGMGLAEAGIHWFDLSTQTIRPSWIEFTMDFTVFGYFAALCIVSGLLFGIAPALRSSKPDLAGVLERGRAQRGEAPWRMALGGAGGVSVCLDAGAADRSRHVCPGADELAVDQSVCSSDAIDDGVAATA